jgi:hypothetical protein
MYVHSLQTKANFPKMEQIPWNEAPLEGQNQVEQCDLALLAYAVYQRTQEVGVCLRKPFGD